MVNPNTCEYLDKPTEEQLKSINQEVTYNRVSLMLFSMLAGSSFLAGTSLTTLYLSFVIVIGM